MPKVSDAHLAARRQQILDAARACFLHNGFHQTSMQDVIRAAGLSVGAVYRYFPSKTELITALAEQVIGEVAALFDELASQEPPVSLAAAMQRLTDVVTANSGVDGPLRLALQIGSESLRDPKLADFVASAYHRLRAGVVRLIERAQQRGELPPTVDPAALGVMLLALMPGFAVQRILTGAPDPDLFKRGLHTLLGPTSPTPSPTPPPTPLADSAAI